MFVTIAADSDDLSYLLFKHPDRVQEFNLGYAKATLWFPHAQPGRYQVALLVDIDSVALAKSKRFQRRDHELGTYINDRPYAASSLLSVAIARVFGSALKGQEPAERPHAAQAPRHLTIQLPSVRLQLAKFSAATAPTDLIVELFEPLGWEVKVKTTPREDSLTATVILEGVMTLSSALASLYVLLPVLDRSKHYWVDETEITKLLRYGESWLPQHPRRDYITGQYLAQQRDLIAGANQLLDEARGYADEPEPHSVQPPRLAKARIAAIIAALKASGAKKVLDLGCGEGRLILEMAKDSYFTQVVGADVSTSALKRAERSLAQLAPRQSERVKLIQASATYQDARFANFDAIVLAEVIEHLDPNRLYGLEKTVFEKATPKCVLVTTPNAEYNQVFGLRAETFRHSDHRFEWSRFGCEQWATGVADRQGYQVNFDEIGESHHEYGAPTQMAVFTLGSRDA
ncbi:MAG: 3' terminal RNA ribose 2'-O-methyltransferase Hen1 [Propionibacteriaceae bacterium]|nr:3' terminal RNA ribose 2'-O-methyltransferase Hen1 [Propionibacteriaceae bacterium]